MHIAACQSCSASLPDGARFCPSCGARQIAGRDRSASSSRSRHAAGQERRITTTLFCDLVGFTTLAEQADAEDVDALLRPYFALTRHVIEQYGGVVEKFIGDAVVGAFGIRTLHEDDAERAVLAALRLQERMNELPRINGKQVQARIGVNTGFALVRLGIDPASGEGFLVGDPVNTAARLQTIAPPGGVVVGEMTHAMATHVATYQAMGPVGLRGKQEVPRVWLVTGGVTRPGLDLRRSFSTAFVGREIELGVLMGMFDNARASAAPQIALIVAEAGLGKTRLVHELATRLDERSDVIAWWRQARCPAYGEGLSLWPLSQIVRQHSGILDDDDEHVTEEKLRRALDDVPNARWLESRLRPLVGLPSELATKEENFEAWLGLVELMTRSRPTVLVFEDVHWASPVMVEFLRYVATHVDDVPLLGIGTARPEFLEAYPGYEAELAGDEQLARTVRLDLHALSPPEVGRLVSALMPDDESVDAETAVAQRCGGNPLYAEELARLLQERATDGGSNLSLGDPTGNEISPSLQALIAARLDTLDTGLKQLLSDAAVLGVEFSSDALAALSGHPRHKVEGQLHELAVRELLRPAQQGSTRGNTDYGFWHGLTREVAYAQMTRQHRAQRHRAVAEYMGSPGYVQTGDFAEVLAHHYISAFTLMQASGDAGAADRLREPTARALASAADKAMALDCMLACRQYREALDILPDDDRLRGRLLGRLGLALTLTGEPAGAARMLESAVEELGRQGERSAAAAVMVDLSRALLDAGDPRAHVVAREAVAALDGAPPSPELIAVLQGWAATAIQLGQMEESLEASGRALEAAALLGDPVPAKALECRAWARCAVGRTREGMEDAHSLLELVRSARSATPTSPYGSIAELIALYGSVAEAQSVVGEGLRLARARHDGREAWALRVCELQLLSVLGQWDRALCGFSELEGELAGTDAKLQLMDVRCLSAVVRTLRGDLEPLTRFLEWLESEQVLYFGQPGLDCLAAALANAALGRTSSARQQLRALATQARISTGIECLLWPQAVRAGVSVDHADLACQVADRALESKALPAQARSTLLALKHEVAGEADVAEGLFEQAARTWTLAGMPYEAAEADLGRARCLSARGQKALAAEALEAARLTFTELRATPALRLVQLLAAQL